MAEPSLAQAAVTIGFAALAGGITNAVAVWMLFHPHARRGFRGLSIQGAIPKNRARLARTIGRTVGERLLTSDDLARQLASPEIRGAFADTLRGFVRDLVETERDTLRDLLPPALIAELEALSDRIGPRLADRVAAWAASPDCREHLEGLLARARATYGDRPMGEVLTAARRTVLRERVGTWVAQGVEHPDVERAIRGWLERRAAALADDRTPLFDRLPPGLVRAAERAIAGYLPVALERLGAVLRDPDARARIDRAVHDLFRRFLNDLMLHERLVARLVVTERTITRLLDTFGREGADELARLLDEPAMRTHVARNINDAVVTFLRRPLAEHIEALGPDRVAGLTDAAARQILGALRDPGLREAAIARMDRALAAAEDRTWSDLLDRLPPDRAAAWLAQLLETEQARRWIGEAWGAAFHALLDRRIGRPADHLGDEAADRIAAALGPPLWEWAQRQIPVLVNRLDIPAMVEEKVLSFSLDRMEEIVRRTTQRELNLIVRLGYLLGAVVGAAAYGFSLLL